MIVLKPVGVTVAVVLLLVGCHKAASQVRCYSGEACRPDDLLQEALTTPDGCCSSFPNVPKSHTQTGSEECLSCGSFTYRCFVAECDDADLNVPDSEITTYAMNDGERVCCSIGLYRSWTDASQGTCNLCPVPVPTTMDIPELTTKTSTTTLPKATSGQGVKTDSESRPQNPTSNNENVDNQSSGSGRSQHCIAGTVIITIALAMFALI